MAKVTIEIEQDTLDELERMREELDCDTVDSTILQLIDEAGYGLDDDDEDIEAEEGENSDEDGDIPDTGEDAQVVGYITESGVNHPLHDER